MSLGFVLGRRGFSVSDRTVEQLELEIKLLEAKVEELEKRLIEAHIHSNWFRARALTAEKRLGEKVD